VPFGEVGELVTLAEAHLGAGDAPRAREVVERELTLARQRGLRITEIRGLLERLTLQVERLADRMPDLDSPGPLERAREAITGKDHT